MKLDINDLSLYEDKDNKTQKIIRKPKQYKKESINNKNRVKHSW